MNLFYFICIYIGKSSNISIVKQCPVCNISLRLFIVHINSENIVILQLGYFYEYTLVGPFLVFRVSMFFCTYVVIPPFFFLAIRWTLIFLLRTACLSSMYHERLLFFGFTNLMISYFVLIPPIFGNLSSSSDTRSQR